MNRLNQAPKGQPSTALAQPKRRSNHIVTSTAKRKSNRRIKTTMTISDDTTIFGNSSAQMPLRLSSPTPSQPEHGSTSMPLPPLPHTCLLDSIPGDWLPSLASKDRSKSFGTKPVSVCEKLVMPFFTSEKLGFFEKLVKDNCPKLLDLGDVAYSRLISLSYANLETKSTPKGMIVVSNMKGVQITLSRSVLKSISSLKFIDTTPVA